LSFGLFWRQISSVIFMTDAFFEKIFGQ